MKYNPLIAPDPEEWLEADDVDNVLLILEHHRKARVKLPNEELHAVIHLTVENQAALGDETPVAEALLRLMSEGLDRHDAIHAVGCVLTEHLRRLLTGSDSEMPDADVYYQEVRQLTAEKWFEQFGETDD